MGPDKDIGAKLISDIVFLSQRANSKTCEVAARTIERLAVRHIKEYPANIRNLYQYQTLAQELCLCVVSLRDTLPGTGDEIMAKRKVLDLLLVISNEIKYDTPDTKNSTENTVEKQVRVA